VLWIKNKNVNYIKHKMYQLIVKSYERLKNDNLKLMNVKTKLCWIFITCYLNNNRNIPVRPEVDWKRAPTSSKCDPIYTGICIWLCYLRKRNGVNFLALLKCSVYISICYLGNINSKKKQCKFYISIYMFH